MINQILATKKGSKILLAILAVVFLCSYSTIEIYAQSTDVRVVPDTLTVGVEGQPIPTEPFTVSVNVTDVTDLWAWNLAVFYDPLVVNFSAAWLPTGHVFDGKAISPVDPDTGTVSGFGDYVTYGASLQGTEPGFDGSGILCKLNFTAVANGVTTLNISIPANPPVPFETLLVNSTFDILPIATYDSTITVIPEFPILSILVGLTVLSIVVVSAKKRWLQKLSTHQKV